MIRKQGVEALLPVVSVYPPSRWWVGVENMVVFWEWQGERKTEKKEAKILFGSTRSGGQPQNIPSVQRSSIVKITHCQTTHSFGALSEELHSSCSSPSLDVPMLLWYTDGINHLHGRYWQFGCLAICNLDVLVARSWAWHLVCSPESYQMTSSWLYFYRISIYVLS